ncbi:MAG: hypothetical protein M3Y58_08490 [Chloroflexota bacterium]|nr:hypothetical protein [Chloroflexota bacterium]
MTFTNDPPLAPGELPYPQTPEEVRARAYRVSLVNRAMATMARGAVLRGNPYAAAKNRLDWRPIEDFMAEQEP